MVYAQLCYAQHLGNNHLWIICLSAIFKSIYLFSQSFSLGVYDLKLLTFVSCFLDCTEVVVGACLAEILALLCWTVVP